MCWKLTARPGAKFCRLIKTEGNATDDMRRSETGELRLVRADGRITVMRYDTVMTEGAAGSSIETYQRGGRAVAVLRYCDECKPARYVQLRLKGRHPFSSDLRPIAARH